MPGSAGRFLGIAVVLAGTTVALAQSAPFDMSPEHQLVVPPPRAAPTAPPSAPAQSAPTPAQPPVEQTAGGYSRYLLPGGDFQLAGEDARRAVGLYLTAAQAAAPATLELGYQNAVVASPEASQLRVDINGTNILVSPVASPNGVSRLTAPIPAGVLHQGANLVEFAAVQRHRTDCSIDSTYELWTKLDPDQTLVRFAGDGLDRVTLLNDIGAVGLDDRGTTTVNVLAPGLGQPEGATAALELVQYLGLALHIPNPDINVVAALPEETPPGTLNVILGTSGELPASVASLRQQTAAGPLAAFLPETMEANTLVVSGPDWPSVEQAVRAIGEANAPANPSALPQRVDLPYLIPKTAGGATIKLGDVGVRTVQFNGRRYQTSFQFALPPDFYANMYGEAELVLNAAYSSAVLPASQFNIYVNGQIASSTSVLRTDRTMSRDTPIRIPMTNFRAGRNRMDIEVALLTNADAVCPPGLTQTAPNRFLLSSETKLVLPDFARIAALPDLGALTGTGSPYAGSRPVQMFLGQGEQVTPAMMAFISRLAISAGAVIPIRLASNPDLDPTADALIAAPLDSMPDTLASRSRIVRNGAGTEGNDDAVLDDFNNRLGNSGGWFNTARDWVARSLNLQPENFWLVRSIDGAYLPQSQDAVIVAQSVQPEGGVWTYLTIPDETAMLASTRRLINTDNWRAITGRVSALGTNDPVVITVQPSAKVLRPTQPLSPSNIRLIAANWLSTNVLEFTGLLALTALILTLATGALLKRLGRPE